MSLVEFRENQNGQLLAYEDGVALCSTRDPRKEALNWVLQSKIMDRRVIVIGLGNGYHVYELIKSGKADQVIVVDSRPQLISIFRAQFPEIESQVEIQIFDQVTTILHDSFMDMVAEEALSVLSFRPSWGSQQDLFEEFFKVLTGRSVAGLNFFLKKFGFTQGVEEHVHVQGRLLSIKDLSLIVDTANEGHPQASVVRVLRELIV